MLSFTYSIASRYAEIKFNEKPPAEVRATLKAHSFRWAPSSGVWWRGRATGAADFVAGLRRQLAEVNGEPVKPDAPCWVCKDPAGFLRNHGAAAPVHCDGCERKYQETTRYGSPDRFDMAYEDDCASRCGL